MTLSTPWLSDVRTGEFSPITVEALVVVRARMAAWGMPWAHVEGQPIP